VLNRSARTTTWYRTSCGLKGYYDGPEFFWDYWAFSGGLDGDLTVDYGSDGGQGFTGKLRTAEIKEHRPKKEGGGR